MNRLKISRITLLMTLVLLFGATMELMAIEFIRVRPSRITVSQGDGAVLLVTTRAIPREPSRFVTEFDVQGLPDGVTPTFIPDYLLFPDRGHLFLDIAPDAPKGTYLLHVTGNVYDGDRFIRTITSRLIRLTIIPPISPSKPNGRRGR